MAIAYFKDWVLVTVMDGCIPSPSSHDTSVSISEADAVKVQNGAWVDEAWEIDEGTEAYQEYLAEVWLGDIEIFKQTGWLQILWSTTYTSITWLAWDTRSYISWDEIIVHVNFSYNLQDKKKDIMVKILFDGVILWELASSWYSFRSEVTSDSWDEWSTGSDQWLIFSRSYVVIIGSTGTQSVDIQFKWEDANKDVTIWNANVLVNNIR